MFKALMSAFLITASLTVALLICSVAYAKTLIYCPETKEPIYEYKYKITKDTRLKVVDFVPIEPNGWLINLFHPINYKNGVPLDGYDYWFWSRGLSTPKKNYSVYTFLTKNEDGDFVWTPYEVNLEE